MSATSVNQAFCEDCQTDGSEKQKQKPCKITQEQLRSGDVIYSSDNGKTCENCEHSIFAHPTQAVQTAILAAQAKAEAESRAQAGKDMLGIGDLMQQFENTIIFDELVARSWACPGDSTIKLENRSFAQLKRAVSKLYRSEEEPILSYFRDPKDLSTTQLINSDETLLDYFDIGAPRPKILYKVPKDGDKEPYVTPPASPGQSPGSAPSADTLSQDMGSGTSSRIASVKLRTNVARAAGTLDEKKICCALTGNFEKLEMRSQHLIQICHILPKNLKPEQIETIIKRTFQETAIKNLDHDAKLLAQGQAQYFEKDYVINLFPLEESFHTMFDTFYWYIDPETKICKKGELFPEQGESTLTAQLAKYFDHTVKCIAPKWLLYAYYHFVYESGVTAKRSKLCSFCGQGNCQSNIQCPDCNHRAHRKCLNDTSLECKRCNSAFGW